MSSTLGVLYRNGSGPSENLRDAFIEEVRRQAAGQVVHYRQQTRSDGHTGAS